MPTTTNNDTPTITTTTTTTTITNNATAITTSGVTLISMKNISKYQDQEKMRFSRPFIYMESKFMKLIV